MVGGYEHLIPALIAVFTVIKAGVVMSGLGTASHLLTLKLSKHTSVDEPDPTVYQRQFERIFNKLFAPVGYAAVEKGRSPVVRQLSFQFSVGAAVIGFALITYLVSAGLIVGGAIATYHASGVVVDPVPIFRFIVAFVVVIGFAILFHAQERAQQVAC